MYSRFPLGNTSFYLSSCLCCPHWAPPARGVSLHLGLSESDTKQNIYVPGLRKHTRVSHFPLLHPHPHPQPSCPLSHSGTSWEETLPLTCFQLRPPLPALVLPGCVVGLGLPPRGGTLLPKPRRPRGKFPPRLLASHQSTKYIFQDSDSALLEVPGGGSVFSRTDLRTPFHVLLP